MAKSILEELVTVLGFEIDDDDLKKYNKQVDAAEKGMKTFVLAAGAAAAAVTAFVDSVSNATAHTFKFSQRIGASFEEVQRLTHATQLWGGSLADVESTLTSLERLSSRAARGAGGGELFGFINVSPTQNGQIKDSIQLLKEIADATNKFSVARRLDLLSQFGISERMILLLRKGSKGIEKLGAELDQFGFVLTEEQAENAQAYFKAVVRAKAAVKGLGNEIGLRLTPRLTESLNEFLKWVEANKAFIPAKFDELIAGLEKLAGPAKIIAVGFAAMFIAANAANIVVGALILTLGTLAEEIASLFDESKEGVLGQFLDPKAIRDTDRGLGQRIHANALRIARNIADQAKFAAGFGSDPSLIFGAAGAGGAPNVTQNNKLEIRIDGAANPKAVVDEVSRRAGEFYRDSFSGVTVAPRT